MFDLPEKVLLISHNCPGCEQLRQHLESLGVIENYKVIDVDSDDGRKLAEELGVKEVPNCVMVEETPQGKKARLCTDSEFTEVIEGK